MSRFQPKPHRPAHGIAAVALSALTFAVAVVAPAAMDSRPAEPRIAARDAATVPDAAIPRLRIEVVGIRAPEVAASQDRGAAAGRLPQS